MKLPPELEEYLIHKHRGGISNSNGNNYENIYATKEIVRLFAEGKDEETTRIGAQLENSFVDDLVIIEKDQSTYIQLKNVKALVWGKMERSNLLFDFTLQNHYFKEENRKIILRIVYSDPDCPVDREPIPDSVYSVTEKEYFPYCESLAYLLQTSPEVREWITTIMNYPGPIFPLDMQSASIECIRSQWLELSPSNRVVSLKEIKDAYQKKHPDCPNFKDSVNVSIPIEVNEILDAICGFEYSYSGSNIYWRWGKMNGECEMTQKRIERLLEDSPKDFFQLLSCLN